MDRYAAPRTGKVSPIRALSERDFGAPKPSPSGQRSPFALRNPSPICGAVKQPFAAPSAAPERQSSPLGRGAMDDRSGRLSPIRKPLYGAAAAAAKAGSPSPAPPAPPRGPSPLRDASPIVRGDSQQLRTKYWIGSGFLTTSKLLGKGTFGEAWLAAVDHNSSAISPSSVRHFPSQVVLKVTPQAHYEVYALKEMELLRQLRHPNIVQLVDCWVEGSGEYRNKLIIAMEFCGCGDLSDLMKEQRDIYKHYFKTEFVESMGLQLASAIHGCHSKHIIHRDIKPANIFLTRRAKAPSSAAGGASPPSPSSPNSKGDIHLVLGDFGVSKSMDHTLAPASSMVGTPYYLCPEQVSGQPYNIKGDIWALGVVLFELMTLKRPFKFTKTNRGSKHDFDDLYRAIQFDDPTPALDKVSSLYAPWLRELTIACLRKRPSDRPTSEQILNSFSPDVTKAIQHYRIHVAASTKKPSSSPIRQVISSPVSAAANAYEAHDQRTKAVGIRPEGRARSPFAIPSSPISHTNNNNASTPTRPEEPTKPVANAKSPLRKSPTKPHGMDRYHDPHGDNTDNTSAQHHQQQQSGSPNHHHAPHHNKKSPSPSTPPPPPRGGSEEAVDTMRISPNSQHPAASQQATLQFAVMNQRIKSISNAIDDTLQTGGLSDRTPSTQSSSTSHGSFAVTFTDPYSGAPGESLLVNNAILLDAVGNDEEIFLIVKVMILTRTRMSADQMRSAVMAVVGALRPNLPTGRLAAALQDDASMSNTG